MPSCENQPFSLKKPFVHRNSLKDTCLQKPLLEVVQMEKLYKDSKYFVDMPLKYSPAVTELRFEQLMIECEGKPKREQLQDFVNEHFDEPGTDCVKHNPVDWHENPQFIAPIRDFRLKAWAEHLHGYWKTLCLKVSDSVLEHPERHTLIPVPNPMIVPGDRFREFYYWDSYWSVKGLILSEMKDTVKGMLGNYFAMVEAYGKVPNGGRQYYAHRSQPPYLIPMMRLYMESTGDEGFLRNHIDTLEKEFDFWRFQRSVNVTYNGQTYKMVRYNVEVGDPRPESFYEDIDTASSYDDEADKAKVYMELRTGTESGWDFSSRWYVKNKTNQGELSDINIRQLIPVDLNSLFCLNARIMSEFYTRLNDPEKADEYKREADSLDDAINRVLWDEDEGIWFDYDFVNEMRRPYFYVSNFYPLWAHCYQSVSNKEEMFDKVLKYLDRTEALDYPGGVPTSLVYSGQQWDYPNAWAPLQHMLIEGLESIDREDSKELAFQLSQKWVNTVYRAYDQTGNMFEKYNTQNGRRGSGGEYQVQLGFGWTNGVIMDLLNKYGERLTVLPFGEVLPVKEAESTTKGFIKTGSLWFLWACCATAFGSTNICFCSKRFGPCKACRKSPRKQ